MTAVSLGMPPVPPPPLAPRRASRQIMVGSVPVGGGAPVSVQSMTTTLTADVNATLQQIAELTASGCQIVRVAVPSQDDVEALPAIAKKSQIPVIADIHFQPKYVFAAIDAGCAAVRVNPGNIRQFDDKVKEIARAAGDAGVPIRIGVNAGSLDKRLLAKYGKATAEALVESALWECSLFEEHGFRDIKISVKHNDPVVMIRAYRLLAEKCDYPLHLGVTEAGPAFQGTIKSAVAFGALLAEGIGDTIRVSLSAPPVEEIKVGNAILESLGLRERGLEIVSCPSCGRAQVDVYKLAEEVTAGLEGLPVPLRVAVMGCVVNGPGEAREADLGVASGNGKGQIFVKGKVVKTVPEAQIVETLIEEALRIADEMGAEIPEELRDLVPGGATVTVH
ncbi:flavodoxin-dependent (E)-4-hydroxy-3-methylbut-2-enyl-diphosphate synthase [Micromonospora aurantiaca]|uniref:4-hydroxy-3-methylbut-2-en-1-yl diphosphate synthase (flavodoxin) n=1 Tax=Micromonospora aurantiaca (nom. illeg.) TaxID=47850 RepID=A0A1C6SXQ6_9ACTN|nr:MULTISPECIES: flavodoxin-dependent (E)-4-hydroxy-3-methylbut-2-enyl-diphosphate synthase [Micromonospora]ADU07216.1 1-hydroxy-2-methyl-2-(E)-butenyl 4-diphosphate synthase [Micromonospora sp. L5]AXH91132.1 flavodoxin-dependent (E)-4-hydroxy-3-methylbut-2-enyl-diphosphate synthase [Micromonospora aurantiaca]KAB1105348.1 flavodoxin-dependent (E)-4-hydroxy-3-methylbut-2-enyl-diphosphate synthase [Micromonospora aurantiaca]MBC9005914.1 flavodoxin-dependent (E)-4-hydroxy-3-methylbut-2-enyl-diphos